MEESFAVEAFGALAHPTRLALFRLLVPKGQAGLSAGTLADALAVAPSTLSHHLGILEEAGLISRRRDGRSLIYAIDPARVGSLVTFLVEDCCGGRPDLCGLARRE